MTNHLQQLQAIRAEMQAEHTLLSHRQAWYVGSQAFLMTAFAIGADRAGPVGKYFHYVMPAVGILLSLVAALGMWAALRVQKDLLAMESDHLARWKTAAQLDEQPTYAFYARLTCDGRPSGRLTHYAAMRPTLLIPLSFMAAWVIGLFAF